MDKQEKKFFNGECKNCGKYSHGASDCRGKKPKTETAIRLKKIPTSTGNATTV